MKFKGVIFDFDGTLTDTESLHYQGWVEALKPHFAKASRGRPHKAKLSKEEYLDYAGKAREEIAAALVKKHNLDTSPGDLVQAKYEWITARFKEGLPVIEGAVEVIEFFISKGVKVAILSNCDRRELLLKLKGSKLGRYFKTRVSLDDVENPKPHPDLYLEACKKLGFEPEDCLAFEDTQAGVEAAKAAGLTCFAVPNEYTKGQDFSRADRVLENLAAAADLTPIH